MAFSLFKKKRTAPEATETAAATEPLDAAAALRSRQRDTIDSYVDRSGRAVEDRVQMWLIERGVTNTGRNRQVARRQIEAQWRQARAVHVRSRAHRLGRCDCAPVSPDAA